jgi:16S rRNA (guanine966-N2)-methyltransferase
VTRILGGEFRGRVLKVPTDSGTRPSTGRLREALFSVIASRLTRARVVDLYAGAGSLGFEALSRGASFALFVERHPKALKSLAANAESLGLGPDRVELRRLDALRWMADAARGGGRSWDLAFADPPYSQETAADLLSQARSLVESGRVACFCLEHAGNLTLTPPATHATREQTRRYGQSAFTLVEGMAE